MSHCRNGTGGFICTYEEVFLLAVHVGCADGVVGFVFFFGRFLALGRKDASREQIEV